MSTIALHHILVKSPLLAEDILRELQLGAEFGDLAAEYSCLPIGPASRVLPVITIPINCPRHWCRQSSVRANRPLPGHIRGPVRTQFGYHIVRSADQVPRPMLFDEQAG